jgi:PAS domain S-box-containing protein
MIEKRPVSTLQKLAQIALVAALYFAAAKVNFMVGHPEAYLPVIWLPTGFALAASIFWGPYMALGVFMGSFIFRLGVMTGSDRVIVSALIAAGFALQCFVGDLLFRRFIKKLFPSNILETMAAFGVLFITSLLSPLVGVTSLCATGLIPWQGYLGVAFQWTIASSGSIFIFTPSIMFLFSYLEKRKLRESILWPLSACILGIACVSSLLVAQRNQRELKASMENDVKEIAVSLQDVVDHDINSLGSMQAFFVSSSLVTRAEFRSFSNSLLAADATALLFSWIPRVPGAERDTYERSVRSEGFPDFRLSWRDASGKSVSAPEGQEFYYPVTFIEPFASNKAAFGFDIGSTDDRLRTIVAARDSGHPAVTTPIRLVQEPGKVSFLIMYPVYKAGARLATVDERRAGFAGFINASYRADIWLAKALGRLNRQDIELYVFAENGLGKAQFLTFSPSITGKQSMDGTAAEDPASIAVGAAFKHEITICDRKWLLVARPGPGYAAGGEPWLPWAIFIFGFIVTNAFIGLLGRSLRIQESLRASEERYRMISENTSDIIWALDVETRRFRYISPSIEKMLGYTVAEAMELTMEKLFPKPTLAMISRELEVRAVAYLKGQGNEPRTVELEQFRKDGSISPAEISANFAIDESGKLQLIGITRDISDRKNSEKALKRLEQRNAALIENAPDGITVLDPTGHITFMSPASSQIFGRLPEEMLGTTIADLIHPADKERREETLRQALAHPGEVFYCEYRYLHSDGSYHWFSGSYKNLSSDESVGGIVVNFRDITAEKQASELLRKSQARLELAQSTAKMGSWELAIEPGKESYWSTEMFQLFGRDPSLGAPSFEQYLDYVHPDDHQVLREHLERACLDPRPATFDFRSSRPGDADKCFQATLRPLKGIDGRVTSITGTVQDVSEIRRTERLLRESSERFTELADNIEEVFWIYDFNLLRMVYVSPAYEKVWGRTCESLYRDPLDSMNGILPEDRHILSEVMRKDTLNYNSDVQYRILRTDGAIRWIWDRSFPIMDENGKVVRRAGIESDITDLKNTQSELEALNRELEARVEQRTADVRESRDKLSAANAALERASRLKDEFLASMSHELRTPLTGILGLSEALQLQTFGTLTERQDKVVREIESSGRHLLDLINDILDLSKIEAGKLDLALAPCRAAEVCQASMSLVKGVAQQKRLNLGFSMNLPEIMVRADARRLKQMLVNLLSNAVKFTPEGGSIGLDVAADNNEKVLRFTVWDKGIGIKPEDLAKLFRPFVQLDSGLARQYSGTGLGLSLVKRMAELHGGGIQVESVPGEGSRFTIVLPWNEGEGEGNAPALDRPAAPSSLSKALIVEDNDLDADKISRHVQRLGLESIVIATMSGALEKAAELQPGTILLDLNLPDGSGLTLLETLKSDPRTKAIPVIIVSVEEKRQEAMALGAQGYIVKPYALEELRAELEKAAAFVDERRKVLVIESMTKVPVVLIAEDNELILDTVASFLESKGYRMVAARNGLELLEAAPGAGADIMLVDIQMPGMDGLEAIRRIRASDAPGLKTVPIVVTTALAMSGDRDKCLAAGANAYVSKPFVLTQLEKLIRDILVAEQAKGTTA